MRTARKSHILFVFIIVILLVSGWFLPNRILTQLTTDIVNQQINNDSSKYYKIEYDDLHTNLLAGSVQFKNLTISPKQQDALKGTALYSIRIPLFEVNGFESLTFVRKKTARIGTIEIHEPRVEIIANNERDATANAHQHLVRDIFTEHFTELSVDHFEIINGSFLLVDSTFKATEILQIDSFNLLITKTYLSDQTLASSNPVRIENLYISTGQASTFLFENYDLYWMGMNYNMGDSLLTIQNLTFKNNLDFKEFNKAQQYSRDWYNFQVGDLQLIGFNPNNFMHDSNFTVQSLHLSQPKIEIKRDKNLPLEYKKKKLPVELLSAIEKKFMIDTLLITDGFLNYEETPMGSNKAGKIYGSDIYSTCYYLGNCFPDERNATAITVDLIANIYEKTPLKLNLLFERNARTNAFNCAGSMEKTYAKIFNPILEPLARFNISSGQIQKFSFDFRSANNQLKGKLLFDYSNLEISLIPDENNKRQRLKSFIANQLIRSNNLPGERKYKTGVVYHNRNVNKSFPAYLWSGVKSGLFDIASPLVQ